MVDRYMRRMPPMVFQHPQRGQVDCWARALSSWATAVEGDMWTPDDILERYSSLTVGTGMLDFDKHFKRIEREWRMESSTTGGTGFTPGYVYERLAFHSYVYMIFPSGGSGAHAVSHAVVVYGISNANGEVPLLHSMDPMRGYVADAFSTFGCKSLLYTAWRPARNGVPDIGRGPQAAW